MLPDYITTYLDSEGICKDARSDPLATFATLRLDALDLQIMAMLIEDHTSHDVRDIEYEAWQTLADVARTAQQFAGVGV